MEKAIPTVPISTERKRFGKLLILVGILWLLLAGALLVYQLIIPSKVEITWQTATEQQTAGFNIYRSTSPDGEFVLINIDKMIDSEGSPISGANYRYIDDGVEAGESYYYVLEEIEYDSTSNRYKEDMFMYSVPDVSWWAVILTAGSAIIGMVILMAGLREERTQ
ncbi:MAG: hypothetical protein R3293_05410 [Candidatus Promineifilaceae bacterium]|nr:hypothetical protein [Candidatus Promineifilaceae bacterium]